MIRVSTHVEGRNEIIRTLQQIGISANDILDEAATAGANVILQDAKRRVKVVTGNLKDSIELTDQRTTSKVKNSSSRSVKVNLRKAPYGRKIEYRHKSYMRPAFDSNQTQAAEAVNNTVSEAIGRVVR